MRLCSCIRLLSLMFGGCLGCLVKFSVRLIFSLLVDRCMGVLIGM